MRWAELVSGMMTVASLGGCLAIGTSPARGAEFRFTSVTLQADTQVLMKLATTPRHLYRIEESADLKNWTLLATVTGTGETYEFAEHSNVEIRFFRASDLGERPRPVNDDFAAAAELSGAVAIATGSTVSATTEAGEPNHSHFDPGSRSVWWKWTASGTGRATVSTIGSHFETLISVYSGSTVSNLVTVAKPRFVTWLVSFDAREGVTYHIAVAGHFEMSGDIRLGLNLESPQSVAAPASAAGLHVFLDESSDPNVPLRVIEIANDGLTWIEHDNGMTNVVQGGAVSRYGNAGNMANVVFAAHSGTETNLFEYTFQFDSAAGGSYDYTLYGLPYGRGRFMNLRDTRAGLAAPDIKRTALQMIRTFTSTGPSGQRHYYAFDASGAFHDSDGDEHASGTYTYSAAGNTATLRLAYNAPAVFVGDSHEVTFQFASISHGTYTSQYKRGDGTVIQVNGDFVLEFMQ